MSGFSRTAFCWLTMNKIILRIYRAPSLQWSGSLFDGEQEIGGVAGCASPEEVEQAAYDAGYNFVEVEIV